MPVHWLYLRIGFLSKSVETKGVSAGFHSRKQTMKMCADIDSSEEASIQDVIVEDPDPADQLRTILPEISPSHVPLSSCLNWIADSSTDDSDSSMKRSNVHKGGKIGRKSTWLQRKMKLGCKEREKNEKPNDLSVHPTPMPIANVPDDRTWSVVEAFNLHTDHDCVLPTAICSESVCCSDVSKGHRGINVRKALLKFCNKISRKNGPDKSSSALISKDIQAVTGSQSASVFEELEFPAVEVLTGSLLPQTEHTSFHNDYQAYVSVKWISQIKRIAVK